jgi:hypothetical protein
MCECRPICRRDRALTCASVWDFALLAAFYTGAKAADPLIDTLALPHPALYTAAHFSLWAVYTLAAGLVGTGLWVLAHECGHQAFSESKAYNNAMGWVLHSALGVPYHSWRISHAKHHASTGHMTEDQVFVPTTRAELALPAFNPEEETLEGSSISAKVMHELKEALGDSPLGAMAMSIQYLVRALCLSPIGPSPLTAVCAGYRLACVPDHQRLRPVPLPAPEDEPLQPERERHLP